MLTSMTITDHIYGGAPFVYEGDLAQGVTQAASLGYDGVELHIADPAAVDAPALEAALRASSLRLTAIGTGRAYVNDGLSLTDADEGRRRAAIRRLEGFLALAGRFQAKIIVGCMRGNLSSPQELPAALDRLRSAMERLDRTLLGQECLVLGFGRIGKLLSCRLHGLGARVTATARRPEDLAWIRAYGYAALETGKLDGRLSAFGAVFNTIPSPVLGGPLLAQLPPDCLLMDLASVRGIEAAEDGPEVLWARSLPGRLSPRSAAAAVRDAVYYILLEE